MNDETAMTNPDARVGQIGVSSFVIAI